MTTPVPVTATLAAQAYHIARGIPTSRVIDPSAAEGSAADDHAAPFVRRDTYTPAARAEGVERGRGERSSSGGAASLRSRESSGEDPEAGVGPSAAEVSGRGTGAPGRESGPAPPAPPARGMAAMVDVGPPVMAHGDVPEKGAVAGAGVVERHGGGTGATIVEFDASGVHLYDAFHFPTSRVEASAPVMNEPAPVADQPEEAEARDDTTGGVWLTA